MLDGKELQRIRKAAGMTQDEVAQRLGVTRGSVGNWERNLRTPTKKQALALAELLDCPIGRIWTDESNRPFKQLETEGDVLRAVAALVDVGSTIDAGEGGVVNVSIHLSSRKNLYNALDRLSDVARLMGENTTQEEVQETQRFLDRWVSMMLPPLDKVSL